MLRLAGAGEAHHDELPVACTHTARHGGASRPMNFGVNRLEIVMDLVIVGLTKRLVMAAVAIADIADFSGSWDLGIAVIGLGGLRRSQPGFGIAPPDSDAV
jgi:hypothetical protein